MGKINTFQEMLSSQSIQLSTGAFLLNLFLAALLAVVLGQVYIRYGTGLSNRRLFARHFLAITLVTTLIIAVVKSSLALSLGLVGALSIVRFRTAIKDPEELSYLFISIAVGLGLGADQRGITLVAFTFIVSALVLYRLAQKDSREENLFLILSGSSPQFSLEKLLGVMGPFCDGIKLKRFDQQESKLEASFLVRIPNVEKLNQLRQDLQALDSKLHVTFLDHSENFL